MTEEQLPPSETVDGVENPEFAPQVHENNGDPVDDDPEDAPLPVKRPAPRSTRTAQPPDPRRGK